MKKRSASIFSIVFALVLLATTLFAFRQEEETLKVELPLQSWEVVLQVIENSNSPYSQVKAVKEVLITQLNAQINPQDSIAQDDGPID